MKLRERLGEGARFIACIVIAIGCARESSPPITEIVFDAQTRLEEPVVLSLLEGELPIVEVEVVGVGRARFVVDSAFEISMLDAEYARRAGLSLRPFGVELRVDTPSHTDQRLEQAAEVGELRIGAASAFRLQMPLADIRSVVDGADGILGQDVIGDWALLFLPQRRELVLLPSDGMLKHLGKYLPEGTQLQSIPVSGDDRILRYVIDVAAGTMHVAMDIDTGSTSTVMPERALALFGMQGGTPVESKTLSGSTTRSARRYTGFPLGEQRIELVIESTGVDEHGGLLGWNALSQRNFILDGPGRKLLIDAGVAAPSK